MIRIGVIRAVLHLSGTASSMTSTGSLQLHDDTDPPEDTEIVLWTMDEVRLRSILAAVGGTPEAVEETVLALHAASLETADDDPVEDAWYDRELLVTVLTQHQRSGDGSCSCGGPLPWGSSFAAHVADAYEAALREDG